MANFQPLVNGQAYAWAQIELRVLGTPVAGVTAIRYEDMEEMQDNWGAGNRPVSRAYGKIECTASLTLESNEVVALQAIAPGGRLQNIPEFPITISYLPESGVIVTDVLHNCRFKRNVRDVKSGDMTIEVELELQISHITWGVPA